MADLTETINVCYPRLVEYFTGILHFEMEQYDLKLILPFIYW